MPEQNWCQLAGLRRGRRRKAQEKQKKEHNEKKRKQEYILEKWYKEREKKYKKEMIELQRSKRHIFCEARPCFSPCGIGNPSILADTF